jgi:hypothetical protein
MARQFNGTNATGSASVDLSGVNKVSIAFDLYWNAFLNDDDMAFEFTSNGFSTSGGFYIDPNGSPGNYELVVNFGAPTRGGFPRPSAGAFHKYLIQFDGSGDPDTIAAWVDGVSQTISYVSQNSGSANLANSTLNFMSRNGSNLFGSGRLAEVAIWPGAILDAGEINALARGFCPSLVRPSARPYYWPLFGRDSPEQERSYGAAATMTNTTTAVHPRVIYPSGPMISVPDAAGGGFRPAWAARSNLLLGAA